MLLNVRALMAMLSLSALLAVGVTACASQPKLLPLQDWPSGTFVLQQSDVAGLESLTGSGIEISFEQTEAGMRVTGYGGCNRFGGEARFGAGKLSLGPLASTKRACVGDGQARERAYFTALIEVAMLLGDGQDRIHLQLENGRVLQFVRQQPVAE